MNYKVIGLLLAFTCFDNLNGKGITTKRSGDDKISNSTSIDEVHDTMIIISFNNSDYETLNVSKSALPDTIQLFLNSNENVTTEQAIQALKEFLDDMKYVGLDNLTDKDFEGAIEHIGRQLNQTDVQYSDAFSNLTNKSIPITEIYLTNNSTESSTASVINDYITITATQSTTESPTQLTTESPTQLTTESPMQSTIKSFTQLAAEPSTLSTVDEQLDDLLKSTSELNFYTKINEPMTTISVENMDLPIVDEENSSMQSSLKVSSTETVDPVATLKLIVSDDSNDTKCKKINEILNLIIKRWSTMQSRDFDQGTSDKQTYMPSQRQQQSKHELNMNEDPFHLPFEEPEVHNWQHFNELRRNPALWSMFETDPGVLFVAAHWVRHTYFPNTPEPMVDPLMVNKMILDQKLTSNLDEEKIDLKQVLTKFEKNNDLRNMFINAPDTLAYVLSSIATKFPELNISSSDEMLRCPADGENVDEYNQMYVKQLYDPIPWYVKLKDILRNEFKKQPQLWTHYYSRVLDCVTKCAVNYALDDSADIYENKKLKDSISATFDSTTQQDFTEEQKVFIGEVMSKPVILQIILQESQFILTVLEEAMKTEILQSVKHPSGLQNALLNYFTRYPYTLEKLLENPMLVAYALHNSAENPAFVVNQFDNTASNTQSSYMDNYCPHHQVYCSQLPFKQQQKQLDKGDFVKTGNRLYYGTFSGPLHYYKVDQASRPGFKEANNDLKTEVNNRPLFEYRNRDDIPVVRDLRIPVQLIKHNDDSQ